MLQAHVTEVHKRLSCWSNPDKIDNIEHLSQMEDSLVESLNRIRMQKENFNRHHLMSLECTSQFQNGMHLPMMIGGVQEVQPLPWLPSNENQHMILTGEPNYLPPRDGECSSNPCLPSYSSYFGLGKTEIENARQVDNLGQEGGALNDFNTTACSRQLNEQYPYHPYSGLDFPEAEKLKPETQMNLQGNPLDYQINSSFQLPRPIYDSTQNAWVPPSEPCTITMFNGNSYSQQQN